MPKTNKTPKSNELKVQSRKLLRSNSFLVHSSFNNRIAVKSEQIKCIIETQEQKKRGVSTTINESYLNSHSFLVGIKLASCTGSDQQRDQDLINPK